MINRVGQEKILCLLTRWVGGSEKGPKHAYVIYERSLISKWIFSSGKLADNHYLCSWSIHAFDIRRPALHVLEAEDGNERGSNPLECNFRRF